MFSDACGGSLACNVGAAEEAWSKWGHDRRQRDARARNHRDLRWRRLIVKPVNEFSTPSGFPLSAQVAGRLAARCHYFS